MNGYGSDPAASSEFVQGLARGLKVIRAFDAEHQRMRAIDIAGRTGLNRATVRRLLLTLETLGYVQADDKWFELTPQVLELGFSYLAGSNLSAISRPYLEALSRRTGESTSITVLTGTDILYVGRVHERSIIRVDITVGSRFPAVATSMGRVLIAAKGEEELQEFMRHAELSPITNRTITDPVEFESEIRRIRRQGWSYVDQEFDLGLRSIAIPVRLSSGEVIAAINFSLRVTGRDDTEPDIDYYVGALTEASTQIARSVEYAGRLRTGQ